MEGLFDNLQPRDVGDGPQEWVAVDARAGRVEVVCYSPALADRVAAFLSVDKHIAEASTYHPVHPLVRNVVQVEVRGRCLVEARETVEDLLLFAGFKITN